MKILRSGEKDLANRNETNCGGKKQMNYGNKSKNDRKNYPSFNSEFHRELKHGKL